MLTSYRLRPRSRAALILLPLLAAACTDSNPVGPVVNPSTPSETLAALRCTVDAQAATMSCTSEDAAAGSAASFSRIVGGQNRHVKLANTNNVSDGSTFQTDVTIQNLTQQALGLDSLGSATGIKVFISEGPTEPVTVANPTGNEIFMTGEPRPYFLYNEVLQPNEISQPMTWVFNIPGSGTSFSFVVLVKADQPDEDLDFADRTWTGDSSTVWSYGPNWKAGVAPDSASSVLIPTISLVLSGRMPVLTSDVQVTDLNVGAGSSLTLNSQTLTAWGNVDALGTITGGTLWMRGSGVLLGGNLPGVRLSGGTTLQRPTTASAAVSISDGSLVVSGANPLSISIP
ncbi:MAG TPA: hypothetical protein VE871_01820 [Longimicrobium sp.]|nr:hypothetical protein [Longimicrobium sp.]